MSLSARDQRILDEIEQDFAATEPRLARALAAGRPPGPGRGLRPAAARNRPGRGISPPVLVVSCLGAGVAMLAAGLVLGIVALACAGFVITQVSPVLGYLCHRVSLASL
ncbi:DUF3040 domain-containing protein [Trebonia sp.]|uniref:DUF3040 domain-containing protein n=1 Tax=Trebonia sp. TaxID=2767075 RepID=UPI002619D961|nr:DUF3040 domain-containing protein [Trebonia sp.]